MKKRKRKAVYTAIKLVCLLVILAASARIIFTSYEDRKSRAYSSALSSRFVSTEAVKAGPGPEESTPPQKVFSEFAPIDVDFESLKAEGKDIAAWLYCENTPINYVVVQGKDNFEYLHMLPDGQYSYPGTLFIDYRNCADISDMNTIIYGHNMRDESMFGSLVKYKDQTYFDAHSTMYLMTEEQAFKVDLLAGCVTSAQSDLYSIPETDADRQRLLDEVREAAVVGSEITAEKSERLLTLSTCSYEYGDARFVLIGKLTEVGMLNDTVS